MFNKWKWFVKFCQKLQLEAILLLCAKGCMLCSDLSCKNMMVSFSYLISFSSLISKLEHDQLFRATPLRFATKNSCELQQMPFSLATTSSLYSIILSKNSYPFSTALRNALFDGSSNNLKGPSSNEKPLDQNFSWTDIG